MKIMAVDYGAARTGIAACDASERLASPVTTIFEHNRERLVKKISDKALEIGAELIVVGLPKNMDGSEGESARNTRSLAAEIGELCGIKTDMWDERCTTVAAHNILNNTDVRGKKRKQAVDNVAAMLILEGYMSRRKASGESETK